jgi:hypothetical protein
LNPVDTSVVAGCPEPRQETSVLQLELLAGIEESSKFEPCTRRDGYDEMRSEVKHLLATVKVMATLLGADQLNQELVLQNFGNDEANACLSQVREANNVHQLHLVVQTDESTTPEPGSLQAGYDDMRREIKLSLATVKAIIALLPWSA